jgi:hypothetical protein
VSSLGIPATGIGQVLKVLPAWSKNNDYMIVVSPVNSYAENNGQLLTISPDVEHTSAVIILHDPHAPYEHSTLCIPEGSSQVLCQKYYHGRHRDSMNIGPLAWQVQNLATDLNLNFCTGSLGCLLSRHLRRQAYPEWVSSTIKPVNSMVLAPLGSKPRSPGRYSCPGFVTNEEISSSLRHRGYGLTDLDKPVEGFFLGSDRTNGRHTWFQHSTFRTTKSSSSGSGPDEPVVALRLPEAIDEDLERQLSGLSAN